MFRFNLGFLYVKDSSSTHFVSLYVENYYLQSPVENHYSEWAPCLRFVAYWKVFELTIAFRSLALLMS